MDIGNNLWSRNQTQVPLLGVQQSQSLRHQVCSKGSVYLKASQTRRGEGKPQILLPEGGQNKFYNQGLRLRMCIDEKGGETGLFMRKGGTCTLSKHVCDLSHVHFGVGT